MANDRFSLAALDTPAEVTLDPAVWERNLAALQLFQPDVARQMRELGPPQGLEPAVTIDAFPAYLESGAEGLWLGDSAIPRTRADAFVRDYQCGDLNASLPDIGSGAELLALLERLPYHKAVYVFLSRAHDAAAVLSLLALSEAIAAGRCFFVAPADEASQLNRLLSNHPGLLPPGNILRLPNVSDQRLSDVIAISRTVLQETSARRTEAIAQLGQGIRPLEHSAETRVAVISAAPDRRRARFAEFLAQGAAALGYAARDSSANGPLDVHFLAHARMSKEFHPTLTIFVEQAAPARLPRVLTGATCRWRTTSGEKMRAEDDVILHLAAAPSIESELRRDPALAERVIPFYWACDHRLAEPKHESDAVFIIGDMPASSDKECEIELPTHRGIWRHARDVAARQWEGKGLGDPEQILSASLTACQFQISDAPARERMLRLIAEALIPAVVMERISQLLRDRPDPPVALGRGWAGKASGVQTLCDDFWDYIASPELARPRLAVFVGTNELLSPELVAGAALGWPVLLYAPPRTNIEAKLGGVLVPGVHIQTFSSADELRQLLRPRKNRSGSVGDMPGAARRHLLARHTYVHRMQSLMAAIGSGDR